jgi:hypothetical protein
VVTSAVVVAAAVPVPDVPNCEGQSDVLGESFVGQDYISLFPEVVVAGQVRGECHMRIELLQSRPVHQYTDEDLDGFIVSFQGAARWIDRQALDLIGRARRGANLRFRVVRKLYTLASVALRPTQADGAPLQDSELSEAERDMLRREDVLCGVNRAPPLLGHTTLFLNLPSDQQQMPILPGLLGAPLQLPSIPRLIKQLTGVCVQTDALRKGLSEPMMGDGGGRLFAMQPSMRGRMVKLSLLGNFWLDEDAVNSLLDGGDVQRVFRVVYLRNEYTLDLIV